jgi:peptide/nickel transport system substrate-binding protein
LGLLLVLLLVACVPQAERSVSDIPAPERAEAPRSPKVLTIAVQRELKDFARFSGAAYGGGQPGSGNNQVAKIAHNYLAVSRSGVGSITPQLATELPSVERGTWRINADGSMDTIWRLQPNVKWHDGTPFTAADVVFGSSLFRDADCPTVPADRLKLVEGTAAPDPLSFTVHWSRLVSSADDPTDFDPMPRHLLESLYQTDKMAIITSPLLSSGFVGLGPYRVDRWEPGIEIQFTRFEDYYRGRPPLDRVIVRYVADPNTMLANVLAGTVDVALPPGPDLQTASEVKKRWEGTGNEVITAISGSQQFFRPQFRTEYAQPREGAPLLTVRRALHHGIDRQALVEAAGNGLPPVADSWLAPDHPWRTQLETYIPQYPYDPARALRLLADAGWIRGGDGVLVHQRSGERFDSKITARPTPEAEKTLAVIADGWKQLGILMRIEIAPPSLASDRKYLGTQPLALMSSFPASPTNLPPLHSSQLASDANRWGGTNYQGYSNPRVDALIDRITATIDLRQQIPMHGQLLQEAYGDVAFIPLYWQVDPVFVVNGVKGVIDNDTRNIFEWSKA